MGGERISPDEDDSSLEQEFIPTPFRNMGDLSSKLEEDNESGFGESGSMCHRFSGNTFEMEVNERRRRNAYAQVLRSYDELGPRIDNLEDAKNKILRYTPGAWIEKVGGMKLCDFDVPKTTTLLLIGPKGSGKSSLVNKISRVFEDDKFASERAQVSYNSSIEDGTYFLQEYMIPRGSTSFCLYDTRSLSYDSSENMKILNHWMTKCVRHGELVMRDSDSSNLRIKMKCKARQSDSQPRESRVVNFVIFVVNGLSILKSINSESDGETEGCYTHLVAAMFNSQFLSFKDDKPVVVVTHGDLLSLSDRARIRVHLGELLGIPPKTQIFDIPESCDPAAELTIIDMLRYSLEHADKNLPGKGWLKSKVSVVSLPTRTLLLVFVGIVMIAIIVAQIHGTSLRAYRHHVPEPSIHIDWHSIRHMWLG